MGFPVPDVPHRFWHTSAVVRRRRRFLAAWSVVLVLCVAGWQHAALQSTIPAATFVGHLLPDNRGLSTSAARVTRRAAVADEVRSWKARQLKTYLDERGIAHADCFEKQELVERVLSVYETPAAAPVAGRSSVSPGSPSGRQRCLPCNETAGI
eukprot:TRINITY_DN21814_c0_g1_i1.p1 TRINITY_DN21814_c0_g1~~TRINITY_DN21814_c0_g1_i1.p1  ORF type:complete len:153 (+),score=11.78 TRINITY_DN21814_c0_g1_i1:60-518(+)